MGPDSVYLWTLPMFHCNGWTFTWGVTAVGGTHVVQRAIVPTEIFDKIERLGVTHLCGAPTVLSMLTFAPGSETRRLKEKLIARQGVRYITAADLAVMDESGKILPADGQSMGEICTRGNTVMMGYLKNPEASNAAFRDGWFHSGDLGVMHPDGYVEVKDRSKDIIISGGEYISSLEVEEIMSRHPAIREVAVVAKPDSHWGETPCAFVT